MRLFIAVSLAPAVRDLVARLIAELRSGLPRAKWVRPEDVHLTLHFLGEVEPDRVTGVSEAMQGAAHGEQGFSLALGGVGVFPSWQSPRVLWVGLQRGVTELENLERRLRRELKERGFDLESRPYHPHGTLCRLRLEGSSRAVRSFQAAAERAAQALSLGSGSMEVEGIDLIQSRLTPEGPLYSVIHRQRLGEGP